MLSHEIRVISRRFRVSTLGVWPGGSGSGRGGLDLDHGDLDPPRSGPRIPLNPWIWGGWAPNLDLLFTPFYTLCINTLLCIMHYTMPLEAPLNTPPLFIIMHYYINAQTMKYG
jgi:hypothetical protein